MAEEGATAVWREQSDSGANDIEKCIWKAFNALVVVGVGGIVVWRLKLKRGSGTNLFLIWNAEADWFGDTC